mmetsp:Transcript_89817/g.187742  ORF Transcript_89817/g.187742 Transcript_89817/m.187742 type:complete len:86 (+) Transcript_89817:1364-1621(+)
MGMVAATSRALPAGSLPPSDTATSSMECLRNRFHNMKVETLAANMPVQRPQKDTAEDEVERGLLEAAAIGAGRDRKQRTAKQQLA